jgi:anti-sigma B factor antagonist
MSLKINVGKINDVPSIELVGRIIDVDVDKFSKKLDSVSKKGSSRIVIDLTKTNFVDSHGLGIIVYYNTLLQKDGRQLVILNANTDQNSYVTRLFELTNLDKVLNIVSSAESI